MIYVSEVKGWSFNRGIRRRVVENTRMTDHCQLRQVIFKKRGGRAPETELNFSPVVDADEIFQNNR